MSVVETQSLVHLTTIMVSALAIPFLPLGSAAAFLHCLGMGSEENHKMIKDLGKGLLTLSNFILAAFHLPNSWRAHEKESEVEEG